MWPFTRKRESLDDAPVGFSTYTDWWLALGAAAGMPYDPPSDAEIAAGDARVAQYTTTSGFFYDKDLARFGNAVSPFVEMTHEAAHLAEQRRFEDRYDPKYFDNTPPPATFFGSRECWARPGMFGLSPHQDAPDAYRVPCPHESAARAARTQGWFAPPDGEVFVGAPESDPLVVAIQTLLNELWGFVASSLGYIRPTGVMTPHTKELIQSFQQNYNVPPGDGTPNIETARALEAAVAEKLQLIQHASAAQGAHAASGAYYVGEEPDWSPLARGCPRGTWWDSLRGECRPVQPPPTHAVEGAAVSTLGFYTPRSEGAMVDLMLALQNDAGIPMTGAMPRWTARAYGVLFAILWDGPDESVRVAVLDAGHADLGAFWQHITALMARG